MNEEKKFDWIFDTIPLLIIAIPFVFMFFQNKEESNVTISNDEHIEIGDVLIEQYENKYYDYKKCYIMLVQIYSDKRQKVEIDGMGSFTSILPYGCESVATYNRIGNGEHFLLEGSQTYAAFSQMNFYEGIKIQVKE